MTVIIDCIAFKRAYLAVATDSIVRMAVRIVQITEWKTLRILQIKQILALQAFL